MKNLLKNLLGLWILFWSVGAIDLKAAPLSASVYERFYTPYSYSFGSDGAARLRRDLVDRGFKLTTVNLRLAYSEKYNQFYFPRPRTNRSGIEDVLIGAVHDEMRVILRPVLIEDPGAQVLKPRIDALSSSSVKNLSALVDSLDRFYALYAAILRKHTAEEFVMPSGLSFLLTKDGLPYLNRLARSIRLRSGFNRFHLSLELRSEDIEILRQSRQDLGSEEFLRLLEPFTRIRLFLPDVMGLQSQRNLANLEYRLRLMRAQVENLLPERDHILASVTLPSCVDFEVLVEGRVDCPLSSKTLQGALQTSRLEEMLNLQKSFSEDLPWTYVEINYGLTDVEPDLWEPFSEFLIWNSSAKRVIENYLKLPKLNEAYPRVKESL